MGLHLPLMLFIVLRSLHLFSESRVMNLLRAWDECALRAFFLGLFYVLKLDLLRVGKSQGQRIALHMNLHGIAQGSQLFQRYLLPRDQAHIQKMVTERAFPAYLGDRSFLIDL